MIEESRQLTESYLNEITFDVHSRKILGFLKNPYKDEYRYLKFEVVLLVTKTEDIDTYINT